MRGERLENPVNVHSPERAHQLHGVRENSLDKKQGNSLDKKQDKDNSCLLSFFLFANQGELGIGTQEKKRLKLGVP